jgi:preprotein translocase subunit SecG
MYLLLIILIVIAALFMCFFVLIQNSKGGGLASGFSSSNQIMGVRKTTDFLEKTTWGLAISIVMLSIIAAHVLHHAPTDKDGSIIKEQAQQEEQTNPMNLPGFATPTEAVPETSTDSTGN